jgi:periplasmic protein TonB
MTTLLLLLALSSCVASRTVVSQSYPAEARKLGVQGPVKLKLTVDATGVVTAAEVLSGPGHGLDEAALELVRAMRFEPSEGPRTFLYTYTFVLD